MRLLIVCLLLLALAACAKSTPPRPEPYPSEPVPVRPAEPEKPEPSVKPEPGTLSLDGLATEPEDVVALALGHDYVLFGEAHADKCSQKAIAGLLAAWAEATLPDERPAVGLEMVDVTRQDVLDAFNAGDMNVDELAERLEWATTWGYPFEAYRPYFDTAQEYGLPLIALNLPRHVVKQVSAGGVDSLPPEDALLLPVEIVPPPEAQQEMLGEMFAMHDLDASESEESGEDMDARRERFFLIQSLWDSTMAERAVDARRALNRPLAVLAGAGHVDYGWGIPHRIAEFDPDARVLLASVWRGRKDDAPGPEAARIAYYCPPMHRSSLGMTLVVEDGRVRVTDVAEGSRAEEAGLKPGDVLTRAGGETVTGLFTLHLAGTAAKKAGNDLELTVDRGGEEVTVTLPLNTGND